VSHECEGPIIDILIIDISDIVRDTAFVATSSKTQPMIEQDGRSLLLTGTMQIRRDARHEKEGKKNRAKQKSRSDFTGAWRGRARSEYSEILITIFARCCQTIICPITYYVSIPGDRHFLRFAPYTCPSDARAWRKWPLDQGPARLRNFHRVGGYPLFRITGSLREVRSCRPSAG